jgi:fumarate hydratase subunit alpha
MLEGPLLKLLRMVQVKLPRDVENALRSALDRERSKMGKIQLRTMLDNAMLAEKLGKPICQDTGFLTFYVNVGADLKVPKNFKHVFELAVRKASKRIPLRPSMVHPLTRKNPGDNVGIGAPTVDWNLVNGNVLEVTLFAKGAGCDNMSSLHMLTPGDSLHRIKQIVIEEIITRGSMACPPLVIGLGIGGSSASVLKLAERALLKPMGLRHRDASFAQLEEDLLNLVNATGIGPMGLGGSTTALDVKVEYACTHTASLPVGIVTNCWCLRRATARITSDGFFTILDEK